MNFLSGSEEKRPPCGLPSAKRRRKRKKNNQIRSWSRKHSCFIGYVKIEPGNLADWHWRRCSTKDRRETERWRRRIHPSRRHLFWLRRYDALRDFLRIFFQGNFLAICSKSSRIQCFDNQGNFLCCLQFPEGAIQRPSDLSINEEGDLAVVSLTGQCFLFRLKAGDPNNAYVTRGPKPAHKSKFIPPVSASSTVTN